jgi:uncharacterized RDD family membrane protein YckC
METENKASWDSRFWAWLIDILLVGVIWGAISGAFGAIGTFGYLGYSAYGVNLNLDVQSIILFIYWTVLEGYRGQSIGKMALNLAVVRTDGQKASYADTAIESFGKAFLLPLDCLIGWLAMPGSGQRLFNRVSNTEVVRTAPQCQG